MTANQRTGRRVVVAGVAAALAGCAYPGPPDEDEADAGGGGGGRPEPRDTVVCRTVTRDRERAIYDDLDTWSAGESYTWSIPLDAGEVVRVRVVTVDGARAALEVKGPDGQVLVDTEPTTPLERSFTAAEDGTYYVLLTNEAMLTAGQWDATVTVVESVARRECD